MKDKCDHIDEITASISCQPNQMGLQLCRWKDDYDFEIKNDNWHYYPKYCPECGDKLNEIS